MMNGIGMIRMVGYVVGIVDIDVCCVCLYIFQSAYTVEVPVQSCM